MPWHITCCFRFASASAAADADASLITIDKNGTYAERFFMMPYMPLRLLLRRHDAAFDTLMRGAALCARTCGATMARARYMRDMMLRATLSAIESRRATTLRRCDINTALRMNQYTNEQERESAARFRCRALDSDAADAGARFDCCHLHDARYAAARSMRAAARERASSRVTAVSGGAFTRYASGVDASVISLATRLEPYVDGR